VRKVISGLQGFRWWLAGHQANGLTDDTWVPMLCLDRRIVTALLTELRRAGVPARCTRLGASWNFSAPRDRWCLWAGYATYGLAQERLAEVMPLLVRSARRNTQAE
jgi:hypothetical protein